MSDALVSPSVGATFWAATGAVSAVAARRLERDGDEGRVALMGVLGAFVFAAQMVNFTIPGTGSSGHLGGGLLLTVLLGPWAAFLVMASVLTVQALFFADGGLLALGCNVFNMGFLVAFVAHPLVFRPLAGASPSRTRLTVASLAAALVGVVLGALGVVGETLISGISSLPAATFLGLMVPIHVAIGIVEGLVTAAVLLAVARARPELVRAAPSRSGGARRRFLAGLAAVAAAVALFGSWFASSRPDGLEWSLAHAGFSEGEPAGALHHAMQRLEGALAWMPGYAFRGAGPDAGEARAAWPAPSAGSSVAGLAGSLAVLATAVGVGLLVRVLRRRTAG